MKILVIDDEIQIRQMIREMLQYHRWNVIEAADGQTGLLQARTHQPDIILCDFEMEGLNGHQTLASLRATDATATIPFILMTGATARAGLRSTMELGADDYLAKPFDQAQLFRCIDARLARARLGRQQAEQKLAALRSSILSALPHALKNPLNGIVGYSALLASEYDSYSREEVREMLDAIHQSANSLNRLVDRFLGYTELVLQASNPERRSAPAFLVAGDGSVKLEAVARRITARHGRQGDLVLQLDGSSPVISTDHLVRLTEELLDNACKFSSRQSKIELVAAKRENRFVLAVRDQGRGMTAAQVADVGAFQQFDRRRYEQQDTGLGLATARLLAELNGGTFTLLSEPGQGTTASVSLLLTGL